MLTNKKIEELKKLCLDVNSVTLTMNSNFATFGENLKKENKKKKNQMKQEDIDGFYNTDTYQQLFNTQKNLYNASLKEISDRVNLYLSKN